MMHTNPRSLSLFVLLLCLGSVLSYGGGRTSSSSSSSSGSSYSSSSSYNSYGSYNSYNSYNRGYSSGGGGGGPMPMWAIILVVVICVVVFGGMLCFWCFQQALESSNDDLGRPVRHHELGRQLSTSTRLVEGSCPCYLCGDRILNHSWDNSFGHRRACARRYKTKLDALPRPYQVFCPTSGCSEQLRLWPSSDGCWYCNECPGNQAKPNNGDNRLNCFLCDYDLCVSCVKMKEWDRDRNSNTGTILQSSGASSATPYPVQPSQATPYPVQPSQATPYPVQPNQASADGWRQLDNGNWVKGDGSDSRTPSAPQSDEGWICKWTGFGDSRQRYWVNKFTGERTFDDPTLNVPSLAERNQDALRSMLFSAAEAGDEARVEQMLQSMTDVDATNKSGQSALYLACRDGRLGVVKLLLQRGASPHLTTKDGFSPSDVAMKQGHKEVLAALRMAPSDNGYGPSAPPSYMESVSSSVPM